MPACELHSVTTVQVATQQQRAGHLLKLSPQLWSEGGDEEDQAEFIELDAGGRRVADAGGEALHEATHESGGTITRVQLLGKMKLRSREVSEISPAQLCISVPVCPQHW